MLRRITYILSFTFFISSCLYSQDPRFSQFYLAPQVLNPAMTGIFDGEYRVTINYRNQWNSILANNAFTTYAVGGEYRINVVDDDYAGVGLQLLNQTSGVGGLSRTEGHMNAAFHKQLGGSRYSAVNQYLIGGAQLGLAQMSTDWNKYWFTRQYDGNTQTVDPTIPSGEAENNKSDLVFDLGLGLMWYAVFSEKMSMHVGGSLSHINTPNISLYGDSGEKLYSKWTIHAGGEIAMNDFLSLMPAFYVMGQGPSFETVFGNNIRYTNHDWQELAIRAGLWGRINNKLDKTNNFESMIVALIFEMERWNLGLSYDVNFSPLQAVTNSRGTFEMSLIYTAKEHKRYRVKCPTF
ncbi:MAG TPA: PorP/SprF family type IX secretion system membrane protein [Saprospiraceae bacterium]|nr:PorP/SprF family type IX secretion system membrane protein [Saprospiraceae bacterium]